MSENNDIPAVTNNISENRFEAGEGAHPARIEYRIEGDTIHLLHTEVPNKYKGKGLAGNLATFALEFAREKGLKTEVWCPFLKAYLKKHPELMNE